MSDTAWKKLTNRVVVYFIIVAVLNEIVWRTQSETFWVNFKIFGLTGGYVAFMILQIPFMKKHAILKK
jgi:intracellular septation protein